MVALKVERSRIAIASPVYLDFPEHRCTAGEAPANILLLVLLVN